MINNKQQTIIETIKEVFEGEDMQSEYSVLSYRVDIYFKNINFQYKLMNLGMTKKNKKRAWLYVY